MIGTLPLACLIVVCIILAAGTAMIRPPVRINQPMASDLVFDLVTLLTLSVLMMFALVQLMALIRAVGEVVTHLR